MSSHNRQPAESVGVSLQDLKSITQIWHHKWGHTLHLFDEQPLDKSVPSPLMWFSIFLVTFFVNVIHKKNNSYLVLSQRLLCCQDQFTKSQTKYRYGRELWKGQHVSDLGGLVQLNLVFSCYIAQVCLRQQPTQWSIFPTVVEIWDTIHHRSQWVKICQCCNLRTSSRLWLLAMWESPDDKCSVTWSPLIVCKLAYDWGKLHSVCITYQLWLLLSSIVQPREHLHPNWDVLGSNVRQVQWVTVITWGAWPGWKMVLSYY